MYEDTKDEEKQMGLLLMSYEYQRAKQKCNMLELKSIRLNDMQERYQKRIANIEKLFSKKKTSLESQYTNLQHNLSAQITRLSAAGTFSEANVGSIFASAGLSIAQNSVYAVMAQNAGIDANAISPDKAVADGVDNKDSKTAQMNSILSQRTAIGAQIQATLQTVITALKEAALEELEAKEDRQREPIAEKDAEIQADVAANDTALELAKQREESAKSRLGEDVKGSIAHYGLS